MNKFQFGRAANVIGMSYFCIGIVSYGYIYLMKEIYNLRQLEQFGNDIIGWIVGPAGRLFATLLPLVVLMFVIIAFIRKESTKGIKGLMLCMLGAFMTFATPLFALLVFGY